MCPENFRNFAAATKGKICRLEPNEKRLIIYKRISLWQH